MKRRVCILVCALLAVIAIACVVSVPSASAAAADRLENANETIYNFLKTEITAVASGEKTFTTFTISDPNGIVKWTKEELGVSQIFSGGNITTEANDAFKEKYAQSIDFNRITATLLADHPYELFWYDKNTGVSITASRQATDSEIKVTSITLQFAVSADYDSGPYATDPAKIAAASSVLSNAQAIVARHAGKTDLEKLQAYKDEICQLVSYNHTAADNGTTPYGNPWQMINVFDGDATTNVVCEGYAKAFKYLCDLTDFDGDVECYLVSGVMEGGTGAGRHMWNVVEILGGTLMVDVTNCDEGTVGAPYKLFLKTGQKSGDYYVFDCGSQTIYYAYDAKEKDLHTDGYLELTPMMPGELSEGAIVTQPETAKVKVGATAKFTVRAVGPGLTYQWQSSANGTTWKNCSSSSAKKATFTFTAKTSHSSNYYRCKVTDANGYELYTDAVRLYVLGITTQPKTQKVAVGKTVKYTVTATGAGKTYQWKYSTDGKTWKNCSSSSATSATFKFTSKTSHSSNYYRCRIKDNGGNTVYTDAVRLYVLGITTQPKTQKVAVGKTVKYTVTATGAGKTYQWQYSTDGKTWKNCSSSSATSATFKFTSKTSHSSNYYRCRIKDNGGNTVYTDAVRLYVLGITQQPVSKTVTKGKTAKFTVVATGASKTYQWQYSADGGKTWKNCSSSSAKTASFTFTSKTSHNGNYYRCRVKDNGGNTVYTSKVKLTVK